MDSAQVLDQSRINNDMMPSNLNNINGAYDFHKKNTADTESGKAKSPFKKSGKRNKSGNFIADELVNCPIKMKYTLGRALDNLNRPIGVEATDILNETKKMPDDLPPIQLDEDYMALIKNSSFGKNGYTPKLTPKLINKTLNAEKRR